MTDRLEEIRKRVAYSAENLDEDIPYLLDLIDKLQNDLEYEHDNHNYYRDWCNDDPQWTELHKQLQLHKKALDMCVATISNDFDIEYGRGESGGAQYWLDKAKEVKA